MGGYIMQLQNFSVNDGEGIRTIVFMAGCPLRCAWCANPEGQTLRNSMTRWVEKDFILKELRRQSVFYRASGGGVTFSGGEATSQTDFFRELVDTLYDEGFSLALETCGMFDFEILRPVLQKFDLIFMDLKHIDSNAHKYFTGKGNELILENLKRTAKLGVQLVVRIPCITGVNCNEKDMRGAFAFIRDNCCGAKLELLPYHRYGENKYVKLGLEKPDEHFGIPTQEQLAAWQDMARSEYGIEVVSYK